MNENLQAVQDSMIEGLGQLSDFFGFSPIMGHLYGALLMSPEALSLDDLEEIVGKSKASVSMNMRALERWNMVREVWVKGDRRKFYEAETDLWKVASSILESRERREVGTALRVLEENAQRLEQAQPSLDENEHALADHYLVRVQQLQEFFSFAQLALEMLLSLSEPPTVEDLASVSATEPNS
jgi:DNA-binding transcriptional regulator GbsR (MarR family)